MQDMLLIEKVHSLFHNTLQYDLSCIIRKKSVSKLLQFHLFANLNVLISRG